MLRFGDVICIEGLLNFCDNIFAVLSVFLILQRKTVFLIRISYFEGQICFNFSGEFQLQIRFWRQPRDAVEYLFHGSWVRLFGIGDLKATEWENHQSITSADVIILQQSGNDVSGHPRRGNNTEPMGDTVRIIKETMDFLKNNGKLGIVTTIISRRCAEVPIDLMNQRLGKKFVRRVIVFVSTGSESDDGVNLAGNCYQQLLDKIQNYCIQNSYT